MSRTSGSLRPSILVLALASAACSAPSETRKAPGPELSPAAVPAAAARAREATFLDGSALVVHSAGREAWFADPRDAGLARAVALIEARLAELPAEIPDFQVPPGVLELAFALLGSPFTLRVDVRGGDGSEPLVPEVQWTVHAGSAERARALAERAGALVALLGLPVGAAAERPGMQVVETPAGKLFLGAVDGGSAFHVSLGDPRPSAPDPDSFGLPAGVAPVLAFGLDFARLQAPLELALAFSGPDGARMRKHLEWFGLLGSDPPAFTLVAGHAADRAHHVARIRNWSYALAGMGLAELAPLPESALRLVPADATLASLSTLEPRMILAFLELMEPEERAQVLAVFTETFGLDLVTDVVQPLGRSYGFYLSDTTGGGGLASAVLFVALADEPAFARTLTRLAAVLDERASAELDGRVRTRTFEHRGTACIGLEFPGFPVPMQPSVALAGGHVFAAATPQALVAALDHARGGDAGLSAHAGLRPLGSLSDLQGLSFSDTPRFLRDGYGFAVGLAAALANGVRSATDRTRDPGLVLPPYRELVAGARPTLVVSRIRGDDFVMEGESDRSALVHVTSALGWAPSLTAVLPFVGLLATVAVPNVVDRLSAAEEATARVHVAVLTAALHDYAVENMGRYPDSLEALVTPDENGLTYLNRDSVPLDPWGNPYVYELVGGKPRVFSYGADGVPGGEGADRDVYEPE